MKRVTRLVESKSFEAAQSTLVSELVHVSEEGSWQMELKRVSLRPNNAVSPHNPLTDGGSSPQIGYTPKIATEPGQVPGFGTFQQ